jgi:hypothetical protein
VVGTSNIGQEHLHNKYMVQDQIMQIFDPLMQNYPLQLLTAILNIWNKKDSNTVVVSIFFKIETI